MAQSNVQLPSQLLHAAAARHRRVAIVVGAGCSLEAPLISTCQGPTRSQHMMHSSGTMSLSPRNASRLRTCQCSASTVHGKLGRQSEVVDRLPVNQFKFARANKGYLLAAALLLEGAVSCVMTLNYDLALSDAVRQLEGHADIFEISGAERPFATRRSSCRICIGTQMKAISRNGF